MAFRDLGLICSLSIQPSLLLHHPLVTECWAGRCVNAAACMWIWSIPKPSTSAFVLPTASFSPHLSSHGLRGLSGKGGSEYISSHIYFSAKLKCHSFSITDQDHAVSYGSKPGKHSDQATVCSEEQKFKSSTLMWKPLSRLVLLIKSYPGIPQPTSPTYTCLYLAGKLPHEAGLHK